MPPKARNFPLALFLFNLVPLAFQHAQINIGWTLVIDFKSTLSHASNTLPFLRQIQ